MLSRVHNSAKSAHRQAPHASTGNGEGLMIASTTNSTVMMTIALLAVCGI